MICNRCGEDTVTRNGVCGECLGKNTVKIRMKRESRQSIIAVIVVFVILIGLVSFISSGAFEKTTETVSDVTDELESEIRKIEQEVESLPPLDERAEKRMLEYLNEIREKRGIGKIVLVNELSYVAHVSSKENADNDKLDVNHSLSGKFDCSRIGGQKTTGVQEVLAQDEVPFLYMISPEIVGERFIDTWMDSKKGHKELLLNPSFVLGGFGVAQSITNIYGSGVFCPVR